MRFVLDRRGIYSFVLFFSHTKHALKICLLNVKNQMLKEMVFSLPLQLMYDIITAKRLFSKTYKRFLFLIVTHTAKSPSVCFAVWFVYIPDCLTGSQGWE